MLAIGCNCAGHAGPRPPILVEFLEPISQRGAEVR